MSKFALCGLCQLLLLALGQCDDTSVLLQQNVQSHGVPDEPEPTMDLKDGEQSMMPQDPINIGEKMEVVVLTGTQAGQWLKCKVVAQGEKPNTYDVMLNSGLGMKRRFVPAVPGAALRKPLETNEKSDGVLFFWAVSSRPNVMELVKKNVEHLQKTLDRRADVYLVHYDGNKADWTDADADWYSKNVKFSVEEKIPKKQQNVASMLFAQDYYPPQITFARKLAPELLAKRQYDYIWLLDEDVDFTMTNLTKLFSDAEATESPIVAPSVVFEDRYRKHPETKMYLAGCTIATPMCFMHMPQRCHYRYVNYIEAMFPIMKPQVMTELASCSDCEKVIDRLWCARAARTMDHPASEACAILDQATVVHTNGKTLRKWEAVGALHDTIGDVRAAYPTEFVDGGDLANFRCVN
uniref:Hexosyltransferase n=1 Tax=Alexandrium catenella TaxID=2925 RepID=A0A7S1Q8H9_ALECA|mmetsp:Transcript_20025/g.54575  ORF Transcript_20025/g.54575 Transcript_20025/m.54575 type:complete len:408 (+) Transcript_20025:83-1306(+)|eukprot:CAMPEP_0171162714 /NCGR_PEP_ID=MMETSP0790-20130122/4736_1 /TAXON_ID=2925 /ORGANISM="Alexandrium catenella, Strain OF101" /LENGTH=407 /DNA_ID=CAMNT_0011627329 /DNA_START=71 /DNA_END=1294 /DNA_ORIENTATION=+